MKASLPVAIHVPIMVCSNRVVYTKNLRDMIVINCFVPFLFYLGEQNSNDEYQSKALEVLSLTSAESNHLTIFLKKAGFKMKSAYDTQALLELYQQFCTQKKCLNCAIGSEILRS